MSDDNGDYDEGGHDVPSTALVERQPESTRQTPAQAKVDAVAHLTMAAYERASMLQLTTEEITKLQADFPDGAFSGAASLASASRLVSRPCPSSARRPCECTTLPRGRDCLRLPRRDPATNAGHAFETCGRSVPSSRTSR